MSATLVDVDIARVSSGLSKDGSGYYYTVGTTRINIKSEYYPPDTRTFEKVTHTPQNAKIQHVKRNNKTYGIPVVGLPSIIVYFWVGDNGHEHPLLLQLGEGASCYATDQGDKWKNSGVVNKYGVMGLLNSLNCHANNAHRINISQHENYECTPEACHELIRVMMSRQGSFTKYIHSMGHNFNVGSIAHAGREVPGLRLPIYPLANISVYFSSQDLNLSIPLIIGFTREGGKSEYYKREGKGWALVDSGKMENPQKLESELDELAKQYYYTSLSSHGHTAAIIGGIIGGIIFAGIMVFVSLKLVPHAKVVLESGRSLI